MAEEEIAAAVRGLFDPSVAVAIRRLDATHPPLLPGEAAHLSRARPKRIAEFTAGRTAARQAMEALGVDPQPVLVASDRAPIWPEGLVGSISHSATWCIAVLARERDFASLGVDIEDDSPFPDDLAGEICSATEMAHAAGWSNGTKRIFCAKEAAYKAQYPLTGALFGFDRFAVRLADDHSFDARFTQATKGFRRGDNLPGRILSVAGHLVSGVAIGQIAAKGA
jgi:4'-phosphopantetheinyl transferase EntD